MVLMMKNVDNADDPQGPGLLIPDPAEEKDSKAYEKTYWQVHNDNDDDDDDDGDDDVLVYKSMTSMVMMVLMVMMVMIVMMVVVMMMSRCTSQ